MRCPGRRGRPGIGRATALALAKAGAAVALVSRSGQEIASLADEIKLLGEGASSGLGKRGRAQWSAYSASKLASSD